MGFKVDNPLSDVPASIITGLTPGAILFGAADGTIGQDVNDLFYDPTTERTIFGGNGASPGTARVTIHGDDATDDFIKAVASSGGSWLLDKNGFDVTDIAGAFHVGLLGTTTHFEIAEENTAGHSAASNMLVVIGSKSGRTVPQVKIIQGPAPGFTGSILSIQNNSLQEAINIDQNGRYRAAPFGTTLPASTGTLNLKESGGGVTINMQDLTNYTFNKIDPVNLGATFKFIGSGTTVGWEFQLPAYVKQGLSTSKSQIGGVANTNLTPASNVNAGETDLISYVIPANTLGTNKDVIEYEAWGTYAAVAGNKTVKVYFGASLICTIGPINANGGSWSSRGRIYRTGATAQECLVECLTDDAAIAPAVVHVVSLPFGENLANAITLKVTGQSTASNEITQNGLSVRWYGAN